MPGKQRKNKPDSAGQLEAARIIAAEPLRYPGVIQDWAMLVLRREIATTIRDHAPAKVPYSGH